MNYSLCFLFLLLSANAVAQSLIQGKIINKQTGAPVGYANIGIAKKSIGTLSNADGTFFIRIPEAKINDTLAFSAIGYRKENILIHLLSVQMQNVIALEEQPLQLETVTVNDKKEKNKTFELGNNKISGGVLETDTAFAGRSIALLIDSRREEEAEGLTFPAYVEKARLRIFKNNLQTLRFRIRLNAIDPHSGEPSSDLLPESIVMESEMRKGWLEFDLSHLDLVVTGPFFVTFEQILNIEDRSAIADGFREFLIEHPDKIKVDTLDFEGKKVVHEFAGAVALDLPGTFIAISRKASDHFTCFERDTSFGSWKRVQGIVTATVTLSNQRPSISRKITSK